MSQIVDGGHETFGAKADAKSTATDTTAVSAMQVWKQVSASVQSLATSNGVGTTGYAKAEDSVAADTDMGVPAMAIRQSTPSNSSDANGDYEFLKILNGKLWVQGAQAEDAPSGNGDDGVGALAVRKATPANTSNNDGDYEFLQMTQGRLWTVCAQQAIIAAAATITRPADTTAYASGDLLANSVTAGSVVISTFTNTARLSGGSGRVMGVRLMKSTNSVTNAAFRLHLFSVIPTVATNGDNSPISGNIVATSKGYLGYVDVTAMTGFSDVAWGTGAPDNARQQLPFVAVAADIYGLWEVRGAYTPGNAEVFTFALIVDQD